MMPMTKLVLKGKNVANTSMKILHDLKGKEVPVANGVPKTLKEPTDKEIPVAHGISKTFKDSTGKEVSVTNGVPIVLKDPIGKEISVTNRVPKIFKDSMGKEISVINGLKKMRIRSQDGKDLGEVKVKMLPQSTLLNTKNTTKRTINKPIKFSIVSLNNTNKSPNGTEELKTVEKLVTSSKSPSMENSEKSPEDNSKMLINNTVLLCKPMNRLDQENNKLHNVQSLNNATPKHTDVPLCFSSTDTKQRDLLVRMNSILKNVDKSKPNESAPKVQNETDVLNVERFPMDHLELVKSKFPVVKCEKLILPKGVVKINEFSKSSTKVYSNKSFSSFPDSIRRNQIEEHNIVNNKIAYNTQFDENKECNANTQTKPLNSVIQKPQSLLKNNDLNRTTVGNAMAVSPIGRSILIKTNLLDVQRTDCASTQIINKNVYNEAESVFNVTNSKPLSCSYGKAYSDEPVHIKSPTPQITVNDENNVKQPENSASERDKLSQTWNVIQKALISVPDVELRAKALQALADCGIGVAKHVPITPPENLKTVHDSQSQTDVFGLLELENFILVKQETPTLEKIKQTECSTFPNETNFYVPGQSKTTGNSYIDNEVLFPRLSPMSCMGNTVELDNCFNEFFSENSDAHKVNQILSTPHTMYKKVAMQLQKDLKAILHYDDDGMLSIHRAVIHNHLQELQRLLLVLKASKISIDVETENGMVKISYLYIKCNGRIIRF